MHPNKLPILLLSALAMLVPISMQSQNDMSLSDCVNYAYDHHPDMRIAQLQIKDADWQVKENLRTGLPQFSAGLDFQHFIQVPELPAEALGFQAPPGTRLAFQLQNSITGSVQYNQLLFSNSYLLGLKAARYYREYVDTQVESKRYAVRNQVIDAYLPALLMTESLDLMDKNIANLEKLLADTREIFKAGFAERLDVERLELALNSLQSERDNLVRQQTLVTDALKFTIGMPVGTDLKPSDDLDQLLEEYAVVDLDSEMDFNTRPEYRELLKGRGLSDIQVDLFRNPWIPTVAGFVSASGSYQGNDELFWVPTALVGVSVSIPIFDGGVTQAKRERAIIDAQEVDIRREMLENALTLELTSARNQYRNSLERSQNMQRNLDLANRVYETTRKKYEAGIGSSFELVTSEQQVFEAQQNLLQARYDLLKTRLAIKTALGQE